MRSDSDSNSLLQLDDSEGFELTDLGACSYLDLPRDRASAAGTRNLTENLEGVTSGMLDRPTDGPSPARRPSAPSSSRSHGESDRRTMVAQPFGDTGKAPDDAVSRPASPSASGQVTAVQYRVPRSASAARTAPTEPPRAGAEGSSEGKSGRRGAHSADRLDVALADFLGTPVKRRASQSELERIYGGVFDPDARAKEVDLVERDRLTTGSQIPAVPDDSGFAWDDDELDAPIDPDEVRKRLGRRASGPFPAAVSRRAMRRQKNAEPAEPADAARPVESEKPEEPAPDDSD